MKSKSLAIAVAAAVSLSLQLGCSDKKSDTSEQAKGICTTGTVSSASNIKCTPIINGKNQILANKTDCATAKHSCAGLNPEGELDAWIYVPKNICDKIKAGDHTDLPADVMAKIKQTAKAVK